VVQYHRGSEVAVGIRATHGISRCLPLIANQAAVRDNHTRAARNGTCSACSRIRTRRGSDDELSTAPPWRHDRWNTRNMAPHAVPYQHCAAASALNGGGHRPGLTAVRLLPAADPQPAARAQPAHRRLSRLPRRFYSNSYVRLTGVWACLWAQALGSLLLTRLRSDEGRLLHKAKLASLVARSSSRAVGRSSGAMAIQFLAIVTNEEGRSS
jgi:hypothetical protein